MSCIQIGRAEVAGQRVALLNVDGRVSNLSHLLPGCDGLSDGALDGLMQSWDVYRDRIVASPGDQAAVIDPATIDRFLAPFETPRHLICIGTNYHDHIAEMGVPVTPEFPYAFFKPLTTLTPPAGPVVLPAMSKMVDWEAELGVVIGRQTRNADLASALDCVAGYLPFNDLSARDWLDNRPALGVDWVMQKAHDGFAPMGPWMTLSVSVPDPQALPVQCLVNDDLVQDSATSQMVFDVAQIIVHLSRIMTLSPGDIIATGTPAGVGYGAKPRRFITDGDRVTVRLGILGDLTTCFVAEGRHAAL